MDTAGRSSAFNFCNPFDYVLPGMAGSIGAADRAHLWGLYVGLLPPEVAVPPTVLRRGPSFTDTVLRRGPSFTDTVLRRG